MQSSNQCGHMPINHLKRRDFTTLLGGTVVAWPLRARAPQPAMPVIGLLGGASPDVPAVASNLAAFRQGLGETGCPHPIARAT
jgi:putative ABC transport system substrate-binding protein